MAGPKPGFPAAERWKTLFVFSSWQYVFSFTATVFFAQSNIATVRDAVSGPFGVATGFTNVARTVAVMIPSVPFFTLFGSMYTGLPADVFPISCQRGV